MKILQNRLTAFLLIELGIVLALLISVCFGTNSPEAKTSGVAPFVSANTASEEVEETVTLTPPSDGVKHGRVIYHWPESVLDFFVIPSFEELDSLGETCAGYWHHWNAGGWFKDPSSFRFEWRGLVWFDLSGITSKPSLPFVTSATLKFKRINTDAKNDKGEKISRTCDDALEIATEDWMKGLPPGNKPVPSAPFIPPIKIGWCSDCSFDVRSVVNNWVKGSEDKNGFVIVGEKEIDSHRFADDNAICVTNYGDFSLTVTYKYNKPPIILVAPPEKPVIQDRPVIAGRPDLFSTRTNVALAANGAIATAKSYTLDGVFPGLHFQPAYAIDGVSHSTLDGGSFWRDEHGLSSWLEVDFGGSKTIDEIDVITFQVPGYEKAKDPEEGQEFTIQGATAFDVQYWNGSSWALVESIKENKLVSRKIALSKPITTSKIKIVVNASSDGVARIVEVQAWGN